MNLISNSTAIICLSKINKLDLLKKIFTFVVIPYSVKDEVLVKGKEGYHTINDAVNKGWIKVVNPKKRIDLGLGAGENDAINLAIERKAIIILDDAYAIKAAKAFNISFIRTTTIIFMAIKKKLVNKNEAISIINQLIEIGYYISPKEYYVILSKLKG